MLFKRKTTPEVPAPEPENPPSWDDREPFELEQVALRAWRWRRAHTRDTYDGLRGEPLMQSHILGALVEEVLELKQKVTELERQLNPDETHSSADHLK